ncbi:MAG: hypothetical protein U0228_06395 [Myxococcaceae bacterium]
MTPLLLALSLSVAAAPQPSLFEEAGEVSDCVSDCLARRPAPPVEDDPALKTWQRTHGELSFGYLGQWTDETVRGLELTPSDSNPAVAGSVTEPFLGPPFRSSVLAGATLESRLVTNGIRVTTGVRFPFINFRPSSSAQSVVLSDGLSHDVLVRSVSMWDLRTGIGYEFPFRHVTPFLDVLGDFEHLTTQLVIDGQPATYKGTAFSLGGRVGVRVQVKHAFLAFAVEATALGPVRLGGSAQLGVGF